MAYKMRSGNKPEFKSMGSSPTRSHNIFHKDPVDKKPTITKKSDDGLASVDLKQVNINSAKGFENTDTRLPIYMPGGGDYDPTLGYATNTNEEKRLSKKEKFNSDVSSFVKGISGVPADVIETVTDKISSASSWVRKGLRKDNMFNDVDGDGTVLSRRLNKRKQNKIDNAKPKKVKKDKTKTKNKKSNNEVKVKGGDSNIYNFNNKKEPEHPNANDKYVKPKSKVKVKTKPKSKVAKDLGEALKSAKSQIGEQLITQGIGAGIQALLTPREKKQRERGNPNLSGFSQMQFGRRKNKE